MDCIKRTDGFDRENLAHAFDQVSLDRTKRCLGSEATQPGMRRYGWNTLTREHSRGFEKR